jgi:hypothetical protein
MIVTFTVNFFQVIFSVGNIKFFVRIIHLIEEMADIETEDINNSIDFKVFQQLLAFP